MYALCRAEGEGFQITTLPRRAAGPGAFKVVLLRYRRVEGGSGRLTDKRCTQCGEIERCYRIDKSFERSVLEFVDIAGKVDFGLSMAVSHQHLAERASQAYIPAQQEAYTPHARTA